MVGCKIIPVAIKSYNFKKWLQIKSACFSKSLDCMCYPCNVWPDVFEQVLDLSVDLIAASAAEEWGLRNTSQFCFVPTSFESVEVASHLIKKECSSPVTEVAIDFWLFSLSVIDYVLYDKTCCFICTLVELDV